jgi:2,4-dienoyl-CoA reductase-like NADH-dependent reductase (Old Yellow Enzyme family)
MASAASLFTPFTLKDVTLKNRIAVSPMCQYSAIDGVVGDWHGLHLGALARGGAGLVIAEATAVSPEGRITPGCAGLWSDRHTTAYANVVAAIEGFGAVPGIQVAHAGRKASSNAPWEGDDHIRADDARGWEPIGPSAVAFGGKLTRVPRAMSRKDIRRVQSDFASAARRAHSAGFRWLELHFAHGYLAQSFLSPLANTRDDEYGGRFENRARFIFETLAAVRDAWPDNLPLTIRLGVTEFDENAQAIEESIELVKRLKAAGLDLLDVSIGFSTPGGKVPWAPAFMAPIAGRIRLEAGIATATSWYIRAPELADTIIRRGDVDLVMIGRPLLANPHWPFEAARALGVEQPANGLPAQYAYWLSRYRG